MANLNKKNIKSECIKNENFDQQNALGTAILPLKDLLLFPTLTAPILVGRHYSLKAINYSKNINDKIFVITQRDSIIDDISREDLYDYGVLATIIDMIKLPDDTIKLTLKGEEIFYLNDLEISDIAGWYGNILPIERCFLSSEEERLTLQKMVVDVYERYSKIKKIYDSDLIAYLNGINDSFNLVYNLISRLEMKVQKKENFLAIFNEKKILEKVLFQLEAEIKMLDIERKVKNRVRNQIEKNQKEYYLNEQMKAIQKELGDCDDIKADINEIAEKIKTVKLSQHAKEIALNELKKLKHMNQYSAENSIIKNYLDFLLSLPWGIYKEQNMDLDDIKAKLDKSHFGMKEVKDRIYELIVQRNRVKNETKQSSVLCFLGAPGIGKTSIAYAIGDAMGIPTISIPLGGVKDESVLRGHRKTYIGAMPGKIIQAIKDAKSSNLVIVLDEIGSIGSDWRGNPEDVLLEILDPIQNKYFQDNYLATGFDLSNVIFVATTNSISNINPALLDRLEIMKLSGYTQEEKLIIAFDYIVPKLLKEYGLEKDQIEISEELMNIIIRFYTYESGVRGLEKQLAKIFRKVMCKIVEDKVEKFILNEELLKNYLKKEVYYDLYKDREPKKGVVTALAYLDGREGQEGQVLIIESALVPGTGEIEHTGNLGSMMKESIQIAHKVLISNSEKYGINLDNLNLKNFYINFPSGGVPKDGPSAGVAIFNSLYSLCKDIPFPSNVAMTGEISLYSVLKVSGIKEKLIAAYRNNIKKIFIPKDNQVDLIDIDENILKDMEIIPVKTVDEILLNLDLL